MIKNILDYAQENKCSDIHLVAGKPPIVRHVGDLQRLDFPPYSNEEIQTVIRQMTSDKEYESYRQGHDIDTAYTDENGYRYRLNIFHQQGMSAMAMRLLSNHIPTIDDLDLPEILKNLAMLPRGLVLVTGPTGSGKSTTLAAMIDHVNRNKAKHILTLEDPIEYLHESKKSLVNQREIHTDALDFQSSLRSALREDPDVILVGEMRDYETISLALTAAETGHLVFSTLHTTGAASTIDRVIDAFPSHQQSQVRTQLASVLRGVISQTLLPKADRSGRIAAHEIMLMNDAIGNLIRENKIFQINSSIQTGTRIGMQTLESNLVRLLKERVISRETAEEVAPNPELLKRLLGL